MLGKIRRRLLNYAVFLVQLFRVIPYLIFSTANIAGGKLVRHQPVLAVGAGTIVFNGRVTIGCFPSPFFLSSHAYLEVRGLKAKIVIGDGTQINNNFTAIAEHQEIHIGRDCLIGTSVELIDSDFHGLRVDDRSRSDALWAKTIRIGDNVFIGSNVKVLKGATIGTGSVIANGSIVTGDIPPGVIAGGNPCRVIRALS